MRTVDGSAHVVVIKDGAGVLARAVIIAHTGSATETTLLRSKGYTPVVCFTQALTIRMVDAWTAEGDERGDAEVHHVRTSPGQELALKSIGAFLHAGSRANISVRALYTESALTISSILARTEKAPCAVTCGAFFNI